jgi:hypothetical protein
MTMSSPATISRIVAFVASACACAVVARAADDNGPTVKNTRTPDAPAFVLLGVAPTQVERPTQPSALAVSVLSATAGADNLIPQNYALQVAPYWLVGHPRLTSSEYFSPTIRQGILDTLSFSFVSSRVSTVPGQKADANQIGVGVRTGIVVGDASPALRKQELRLHALQYENNVVMGLLVPYLQTENPPADADIGGKKLTDMIKDVNDAFKAATGSDEQKQQYAAAEKELIDRLKTLWADSHRSESTQAVRNGANALASQLEAQMDKAIKSIQVADDDRRGFSLSFAAASGWIVPDATSAERRLTKWGVWATPSYRPDTVPIELIGVLRVSHRPDPTGDTMVDFGGRATNQVGPFNWSLEYVERLDRSSALTRTTSERLAAIFDLRVRDDVYVTVNYGKDFADPTKGQTKGGILTTIGLSFDFGNKPTIATFK